MFQKPKAAVAIPQFSWPAAVGTRRIPAGSADVITGEFQQRQYGLHKRLRVCGSLRSGEGGIIRSGVTHIPGRTRLFRASAIYTTGTGLMLIVDGSATANTQVWSESIAVVPNSQYTFSFYSASCGNDNGNGIDPSPRHFGHALRQTALSSAPPTGRVRQRDGNLDDVQQARLNSGSLSTMPLAITRRLETWTKRPATISAIDDIAKRNSRAGQRFITGPPVPRPFCQSPAARRCLTRRSRA